MARLPNPRWSLARWPGWTLASLAAAGALWGQLQQSGPIKGFKVTEGRGRPLLMGDAAEQIRGNTWRLQGLRIETFDEAERLAWVITSGGCIYDGDAKWVASTDRMEVKSADGRFLMSGVGFHWSQTNNLMQLSNEVRTVVRGTRQWSASALKGGASATLKALTNVVVGLSNDVLEITAHRFRLDGRSGHALFDGDVRVNEPRGGLTSDRLLLEFNPVSRELKGVVAEGSVQATFHQQQVQGSARGDKAVYRPVGTNEVVELVGNMSWQAGDRQGGGDRLELDSARNSLKVSGDAWVRMPREAVGAGGATNRPPARPDAPGLKAPVKVPILFEIRCDEYTYEPGSLAFRGNVRANDPDFQAVSDAVTVGVTGDGRIREVRTEGRLDVRQIVDAAKGVLRTFRAGQMAATVATNTGALERFTAVGGVEVEQGTDRLMGDRAAGSLERMELLGDVRWRSESAEGGGLSLVADVKSERYTVRSNAWLRLELADVIRLRRPSATNAPPPTPGKVPRPTLVSVQSDEYSYQKTNVVFRGDVWVSDGLATWSCDELAIAFTADQKQVTGLRAERRVIIEQSGLRATGELVIYDATEQVVTLEGQPTVDMVNGVLRVHAEGQRLIWNLKANQLKGTGYRITAEPVSQATGAAPFANSAPRLP